MGKPPLGERGAAQRQPDRPVPGLRCGHVASPAAKAALSRAGRQQAQATAPTAGLPAFANLAPRVLAIWPYTGPGRARSLVAIQEPSRDRQRQPATTTPSRTPPRRGPRHADIRRARGERRTVGDRRAAPRGLPPRPTGAQRRPPPPAA